MFDSTLNVLAVDSRQHVSPNLDASGSSYSQRGQETLASEYRQLDISSPVEVRLGSDECGVR